MTTDDDLQTGTIAGLHGSMGSGLWTLEFDDGSVAHIESGFGVRQLVDVFGGVDELRGKTIAYKIDDYGILEAFHPVGKGMAS
jgi:hypothetical protein|tara:strand:+ start:146 stop:394 length:249 start_codon:yes stop_codon:yes gene_type:complete